MLREQLLQQKLRRSGALLQKDIYQDFIKYAKEVKDEMEVYIYMEENGIGTQRAKYWIARLEVLRKRCELKELMNTIKVLKTDLQMPQQLWEVARYQSEITNFMRRLYSMQFRGKRKTKTFNNQVEQLHPQHRKIGNIEVYVDSHNRINYQGEDLARYVEKYMPEYCQVQREEYKRAQEKKPLSFIAKKQQYLLDLAQQVISKNPRKSMQERISLGQAKVNLRDSSNFEVENYNTPKNNEVIKTDVSSKKNNQIKEKRKKDSSRDSIEILKSMKKTKKEEEQYTSPKFIGSHSQFQHHSPTQIIEKCRYKSGLSPQQQYFSFSFGRNNRQPIDDTHSRRLSQKQLQNKDQAFLFNSFSQDPIQPPNTIPNEDFQLELIINQIQRQRYDKIENRTFSSQINSNQENQYYEASTNSKQRKAFEKMLQTQGKMLKNCKSMNLQDLIDFDDDALQGNPETNDEYTSNHKKKPHQFQQFRSESKHKLSYILQESHFYSQSKIKSRASK